MTRKPDQRRSIVGILVVAAVLVLLIMAAYRGWQGVQAQRERAQLSVPAPTEVSTSSLLEPSATSAGPRAADGLSASRLSAQTATPEPGSTVLLPTAASEAAPAATGPAAVAVAATPTTAVVATISLAAPLPPPPSPFGDVPVRLVFPDLKIDTPVVEMGWNIAETADGLESEWDLEVLKHGAGYHINSAPLGVPGNLVISGHNNIPAKVFEAISFAWDDRSKVAVDAVTDRSDVLNGREIELYNAAGEKYRYVVTAFYRVRDTGVSQEQRIANGRFMGPTADPQLTLVTCWPPSSNTHRLVVIAKPVGQP